MNSIFKVVPLINTLGTERFKDLLNKDFDYNYICNVNNNEITPIFKGWSGKKNNNNIAFECDYENVTLDFNNSGLYSIRKIGSAIKLKTPETINDFINAMILNEIDLFWRDWIEEKYEPKDFLANDEIKSYYVDLLNDLNKDGELI